jgi:hypothetical protein
MNSTSFSVANVQVCLFTPDFTVSPKQVVLKLLSGPWADLAGEPMMLPSAPGLPRELPKLIVRDDNKGWQIEISDARLNVKWTRTAANEAHECAQLLQDGQRYALEYMRVLQPQVGRLAAVVQRFATHPTPGLFLARHFCQERWSKAPFNRPESFEIHSHKAYAFASFVVNSWVRCKTAKLAVGDLQEDGVLVEQDINTLAEQAASRDFSQQQTSDFFGNVPREFAQILDLYFPKGAQQ